MNDYIGSALVPGRFDADLDTWRTHFAGAASDRVLLPDGTYVPVDMIITTETTNKALPRTAPDGWSFNRVWDPAGASNVSVLLRTSRFTVHESGPYVSVLSDDKVWTKRGRLRPPTYALTVPAWDVVNQRGILIAGAHFPLRNTDRRLAAYTEALDNADNVWDQGRAALGPDAVRLWAADWNLSVIGKTAAAGQGLWNRSIPFFTPAWAAEMPDWRHLIDWQAGGKGLRHVQTEWHRRVKNDQFDHPWSVSVWQYRKPTQPPAPLKHACPVCGKLHFAPDAAS